MVVVGLFGKVESFSFERDSLDEACLAEGLEDPIDGGAIASGGAGFGIDLVWGQGGTGFFEKAEDGSATWSGFETCLAEGVGIGGVGVTHEDLRLEVNLVPSRKIVESVRFLCRRGTRVAWFFVEYP